MLASLFRGLIPMRRSRFVFYVNLKRVGPIVLMHAEAATLNFLSICLIRSTQSLRTLIQNLRFDTAPSSPSGVRCA